MHSLCIADQLGVLKSIEHIAKTLHAESQPTPPPYVSYPKPRQSSNSKQSTELTSNSVTTEKASLEAVGTTNMFKDNACSEEEHLNSGENCDNESHTLSQTASCHTGTDPECKLMEIAAASKSTVEGDGLRRRRNREERENASSKAVDLGSEKKVDGETTIDTSRNVYYGVGAGTFLF